MTLTSVSEALGRLTEHAPNRVVLCMGGDQQVTMAQLERRSNQLGHYFASLGVSEGDFVTVAAQ